MIDGNPVNVWIDGEELDEIEIELAHGGKWEHQIGFPPQEVGDNQKVEFLLFKNEGSEPYRTLHFRVDVSPP